MKRSAVGLLLVLGALYFVLAPTVQADDIVIGCSTSSLVSAITTANSNFADDTITLAEDCVYDFGSVTPPELNNALPKIISDSNHSLLIVGNGATFSRSSSPLVRYLQVERDARLTLQDLTLEHGALVGAATIGGGILNHGYLTLTKVTILDCAASQGGGIFNNGQWLYVEHSALIGNHAQQYQGALFNGGPAWINETTIAENYASMSEGGIANYSTLTLTNVSLIGNHDAYYGYGAIHNYSSSHVWLRNTLIGGDQWTPECVNEPGGTIISGGYNLTREGSGCPTSGVHDQTFPEDALFSLVVAQRDGSTYAPLPGSPAIDAGYCPGETADQRYTTRPVSLPRFVALAGDGCDIGAYEAHLDIAVWPKPNLQEADTSPEIAITYDRPISPTSVTTGALTVHTKHTALAQQTPSVIENKLALPLERELHAGEMVQVTALTTTLDITGEQALTAKVWQFRPATELSSGVFADTLQNLGSRATRDTAAGDLDGDGDLDFIAANFVTSATVWINQNGSGTSFTSTQDIASSTYSVVRLGDLDNDGDLDVFFGRDSGMGSTVWLNDGLGHFSDTGQSLTNNSAVDVALGDIDADGALDAVVVDSDTGQPVRVWRNNGSASFTLNQDLSQSDKAAELADLDNDGDLDIFALSSLTATVWLNDGSGSFSVGSIITLPNAAPVFQDVALGDLDRDGNIDAYLVRGGKDIVLINRGDGHFSEQTQSVSEQQGQHVRLGDVDGDGNLDAIITTQVNNIAVWLGDGQGGFSSSPQGEFGSGAYNATLADFNGDGALDLLLAMSGANRLWFNQGIAHGFSPTPYACSVPTDTAVTFEITPTLDGTSITTETFVIHSNFQGQVPGSYAPSDVRAGFYAQAAYLPGELIETSVTTDVIAGSVPIAWPYVWRFRTDANGGSGQFAFYRNLGREIATDVALGDLDGDGQLDAFVTTKSTTDVVWLHSASTWYTMAQPWEAGFSAAVALGDMNDDGKLDAVVAKGELDSMLWLNNGYGDFSGSQHLDPNGVGVAVGDVNGDGDLDAVFANGPYAAEVWLGNGDGELTLAVTLTAPYTTTAVALGDFDLNGTLDLVFATGISSTQPNLLWYNDGTGHFPISRTLGASSSRAVAVGDVNCDGYPDLLFANHPITESDNLWLNQGEGIFSASPIPLGKMASTDVALGDLDDDGDLDAVFTADGVVTHSIWLNSACGMFVPAQGISGAVAQAVALGDLDNEDGLDLFFVNGNTLNNPIWKNLARVKATRPPANAQDVLPHTPTTGKVEYTTAINTGTFNNNTIHLYGEFHGAITNTIDPAAQTFTPTQTFAPGELVQVTAISNVVMYDGHPVGHPHVWQFQVSPNEGYGFYTRLQSLGVYSATAVALGDIDGDGDLDAVVSMGDAAHTAADRVWLNNGDGTFTMTDQFLGHTVSNDVALGDVDADGDLDALIAGTDASMVWFNKGHGRFTISRTIPMTLAAAVSLGDLDGDGDLDAFFAGGTTTVAKNAVWLNDGSGTFTRTQILGSAKYHRNVALGDVDADGDLDAFVIVSYGANSVWLNDGHGYFYDSGQQLGTAASYGVALGDVDSDGDLDAFVANDTNSNVVWLNNGRGCFTDTIELGDQDYGHTVALGDVDDDGDLDAFVGAISGQSSVLWLNDGHGHFARHQKIAEKHAYGVALGDLDGDGSLDVFVANHLWNNPVAVLKNAALANMKLVKTVSPSSAVPGRPITYVLTLSNNGPGEAHGVIVSDTLPPAILSATVQSDVTISNIGSGHLYRWLVADLTQGATAHITLTCVLSHGLASGTTITNTATITSSSVDTSTIDNRASAVLLVHDQMQSNPFIVNTTDDRDDGTCGVAHCSLREAIMAANSNPAPQNVITFSIPGPAPHVIVPQTPLPNIDGAYPVDIDARNAGIVLSGTVVSHIRTPLRVDDVSLLLEDGSELISNGDFTNGLAHWAAEGDSCPVSRTLDTINYHTASPSYLQMTPACAGKNATFYNRQITPTLQGDLLAPTSTVWLDVGGHTVLTTSLWFRDGNIDIELYGLKTDNSVVPLTMHGHFASSVWRQASFTVTLPGDLKAIAFKFSHVLPMPPSSGLRLATSSHRVRGLDILGFPVGIEVSGLNSIGGTVPEAGVVVGNSYLYGMLIKGYTNTIQGNFIGVARDGITPLPNQWGIFVEGHGNTIGGARDGHAGNIFGYADESALELGGSAAYGNIVQGNNIGAAPDGHTPIPNETGITLSDQAHNNLIGGNAESLANVIAYNKNSGIRAFCDTYSNGFHRNFIYANGDLGIDLDADGPTPNDPGDQDDGANHLQNTPVIFNVTPFSHTTVIKGRLDGVSNTVHIIEFYTGTVCPSAGRGEAQGYLGSIVVTTTAHGDIYFAWTYPFALPRGTVVAATATDAQGNTSEFSDCAIAEDNNIAWPLAKSLDPLFVSTITDTTRAIVSQRITKDGQSRWYKFSVTPNSQVVVLLTHLPANYDLTIYKDIAQAYTNLTGPEDLTQMSAEFAPDAFAPDAFAPDAFAPDAFAPDAFAPDAFAPDAFAPDAFAPDAFAPDAFAPDAFAPDAFAPDAFAPDAFAPDAFAPDAFAPDAFAPDAFAPDAFASAQLRSLLGVSAFDGTTSEGLMLNTWNNTGDFYIRVRGRHGVSDPQYPYTLTVYVESALCNNVSDSLPEISTVPPTFSFNALILTDLSRMAGSADEKSTLQTKLSALAEEINGTVVDVGTDSRVSAANAQADAHPMCPYAKNLVADSIKQIVDAYRRENPSMEYVVLVGNDHVIPFFRYPDQAMLAGEQNYSPPVRDNTASQASLKLGYVLGQDEYGSDRSISYKSMRIPLPDLAVGRLVETPADIITVIDAYLSLPSGVLTRPTTALVTGYDFLADDAAAVQANLSTLISGTVDTLITPRDVSPSDPRSWTADDLKAKFLEHHYDLVFLAGHFSASSALAADYSTHLYTSDVLASTVSMSNTILFSAGCHSGYNIVNEHDVPYVTREPDWAQTFARKGATFIGGTGYQYGDTDYIKYSERIYELFSQKLGGTPPGGRARVGSVAVGEALVAAKQDYLAEIAELRGIHVKSYLEATLFGLPMLSVPTSTGPVRPTRPAEETIIPSLTPFTENPGKTLGLDYADLSLTPTLTMTTTQLKSVDSDAVYTATAFLGPDGVKSAPLEPVLPLALYNVTAPSNGMVLRGVGFRGGVYTDVEKIIPLTGAAATEVRGVHAPFRISTFFPVRPWNINYFDALSRPVGDGATKLTLFPAQYRSTSPGAVDGTMRTFQQMNFRLYYSGNYTTYSNGATPALSAPPVIENVLADNRFYTVTFNARVYGDPAAGIQEVWITYDLGDGIWRPLDMTQDHDNSLLWHATLTSTTGLSNVHYIVQAVNGVGLVTMDTNRGAYYDAGFRLTAPPTTPISTELLWGTKPISGPYGSRALFRLQLVALQTGTTPIPGQPIEIGLGAQRKIKTTGPNGVVTITLPLMGRPRIDEVHASFAGSDYFQASAVTTNFTITKQATTIQLQPASLTITPTQSAIITATLKDMTGRPLGNKQLFFVLEGNGQRIASSLTTNFAGIARVSFPSLDAGHYTMTTHFCGEIMVSNDVTVTQEDERYNSTKQSIPVTVSEERSYLYLPLIMRE